MSTVDDASLLVAVTSGMGAEGAWAEEVVRASSLVAPHLVLVEATNIRRLEIALPVLGHMERSQWRGART